MIKKYAISKRSNIRIPEDANTKASTYPVISYKSFRKFATREEARWFKRFLATTPVSIIDTQRQVVVR